jgi:cyclopropane fatty-acyl-phospholipid synthase-like methyltransferase
MSDIQTNDILREWTESATYWEKYSPIIRTMFAPVTRALIEDAGVREGQTVLDVAGGAGEPSLTIAETVGPGGSVVCTDAAAEMIQGCRLCRLSDCQAAKKLNDSITGNTTPQLTARTY